MTGPGDRRAVRETVRLLAVLVGAGGLAFSLTSVPLLRGQTTTTPSWWTVSTVTALLGMLVLLVLAGAWPRASTATLRRLAGAFAVLLLLVLASYPLVLLEPVPDGQAPWMRGFVGAAAAAGATAWRASAASRRANPSPPGYRGPGSPPGRRHCRRTPSSRTARGSRARC